MASKRLPVLAFLVLMTSVVLSGEQAGAGEVKIRIQGRGASARYIEEGQTEQRPVAVDVGDTVVWANEGNLTHTATAETQNGDLLFDTGDIAATQQSAAVPMTATVFSNAGGKPGRSVLIDYFCDHHAQMQASLVLSDAGNVPEARTPRRGRMPLHVAGVDAMASKRRRDITSLTPIELNQYRDAWRRIQGASAYRDLSGYHDCPRGYCHRPGEQPIFLAWHREYVLRMETLLGEPLHYWDWTSAASAATGIPRAFADSTYVSSDGTMYPNPLRTFRFACPAGDPAQTTARNPRASFLLSGYAASVRVSYGSPSYRDFNSAIEGPHGSLHTWVRGQMGNTLYAAYDPIFWAHHANVDRQWASWQRGGGPDPTSGDLARSLTGFSGRIVNDVKSISTLGYEYDRYDPIPPGPFAPLELAALDGEPLKAAPGTGVGKTFIVPAAEAAFSSNDERALPLQLYVRGIPDHLAESYFVYVFVNQPNATPEDANASNPNFAGTFGVFGTGHAEKKEERHERTQLKRVMQMFAGQEPRLREPISRVTLVVTQGDAVVARDDIPFDSVSIRPEGERERNVDQGIERAPSPAGAKTGAQEFTGTSNKESYDEAYQDAVNQAQAKLTAGMADRIIAAEVLSVKGRRGGIAGLRSLTITIRAWLE